MMGTGDAEGDNRALDSAAAAIANPLLDDVSLAGARGVLVNITGGPDLTLFEVDEIVDHIRQQSDDDVNLIFGASQDDSMHNSIRVSVVATGIDCPSKTNEVENIISNVNNNIDKINKIEDPQIEESNIIENINTQPSSEINISNLDIKEEVIQKELNVSQESFIPPEPETIEKEVIEEEVKLDPFTEAEVLNASSNTNSEEIAKNEEVAHEKEIEIKPQEGLIKRFSAKALFGGSIKKQNEISPDKEELLSDINENKQDHIIKEKDELSLEADISMKSVDKNNTEDTLDIPAFLRRQKE
jgi:hypothetical protein